MVIKEFRCAAHGPFEAEESACPHGCPASFVKREFRTAPAIKHNSTRTADNSIRNLAADYGLTNVSNKDGMSVMDALRRPTKASDFAPRFMDVPHAKPGFSQQQGAPVPVVDPQASIGGSTAQGENAMEHMKIPMPRPVVGKGLSYRPSELPGAPE